MIPAWLWPGWDAVWPNLLASLIWAVPGLIAHLHTRRKLKALHRAHDALHQQIRGERE
ncbi:hypothetical protein [Amycolatopsis pigmentata]|uniref:Uncharacterized protein n=1 Tax=Amycolatopsis pigmentata TaxID=450801 RepID=A0ABW5G5R6_9PSEU